MDTLLIVITGLSVVVAAVSSTVAWRVVSADRRRAAARVAALAKAARIDEWGADGAPALERGASGENSPAVSDVPSGLHEFLPAGPAAAASVRAADFDAAPNGGSGEIFVRPVADSGSADRQRGLLSAAAAFAAVVVAGAGVLFISGRTPGAGPSEVRTPLELITLSHARADGQLAVQGVVRNPPAASPVALVDAEVRVFDAAGLVIATRSARIDAVAPGQDVAFTVPIGEVPAAARYRVSFTSDGSMLPHVDRRTNLPAAVTAEAR